MNGIIDASNDFAAEVYKVIAERESGNFVVSPFSAETVLVFAASGHKNKKFAKFLHLSDTGRKNEEAVRRLLESLRNNVGCTLHIVNTLYVKEDYDLKNRLKRVATEVYSSNVKRVDFARSSQILKILNTIVKNETEDKIQNLLRPNFVSYDTRVVFVNTLHLKAQFYRPFDCGRTCKKKFYKTPFKVVKVETMYQHREDYSYCECKNLNAKILEIPFKLGNASMTIILPNDNSLAKLESRIHKACLRHDLKFGKVNLTIPKVKIQSELNLKKIFEALGVVESGGGTKNDPVVGEVLQKIVLEVGEKGVETSAGSVFTHHLIPCSAYTPEEFNINHPFIFYIRVEEIIVLIGRVTDPST